MTTEAKLAWCNKYWDEITVESENVPHYGWRMTLTARRGEEEISSTQYTFAEAVDKLLNLTLELAL